MNLYEAMDATRDVISALDGRLSTLSYRQINSLLASLPRPTGVTEQLLAWRLDVAKAAIEEDAKQED